MSTKVAILLVIAIFLSTLVVRMPAGIIASLLPKDIHCQEPAGTVWQGACAELHSGQLTLADVQWNLHPLALLRARLQLDLRSSDPRAAGRGTVTLDTHGDADIDSLTAALPLQDGISAMPSGWSGAIELALARARIEGHHLVSIEGTVTARQLHSLRPAADLGSFELKFPPPIAGAESLGSLHDIGGPLEVQGDVRLARDGSYEINGVVAVRDPANVDLQQLLQLLGPPDAQGRHDFSLAGTL
jgi:general secretion pathway protein N